MLVTLQELLQLVEENGIRRVDLRVTDLLGRWQHFTVPPSVLSEEFIEHGNGFEVRSFGQM